MRKFVKSLFVLSQKVSVSTKTRPAATYLAQVKSEKLIADMRGYDLLRLFSAEQEVDRAMLDRRST